MNDNLQESLKELIRSANLTILKWKENSKSATGVECYIALSEIKGMLFTKISKLFPHSTFAKNRWRVKNDLVRSLRVEIDSNQFIKSVYLIDNYDEPFLKNLHLNLISLDYRQLNPIYKEDISAISLDTIDFSDLRNMKF